MQDIHTHLYWESFEADRDEVIARARVAGVKEMFVVGTTLTESQKAIDVAGQYEDFYAAVGIHPNEFRVAGKVEENWKEVLIEFAEKERVIAIGECGLDYSVSHGEITEEEKSFQKEAFKYQLRLAVERGLPLIVHCRSTHGETDDAYRDLLFLLQSEEQLPKAVILHCYMGSQSVTKEFLKQEEIHFSFTGNITYPAKQSIRGGDYDFAESLVFIPVERIFTETDCPFLAPQECRGKRNEPAFVGAVVQKIADMKKMRRDELESLLEENFERVFEMQKSK